jgi:hypothetical protein
MDKLIRVFKGLVDIFLTPYEVAFELSVQDKQRILSQINREEF